MNNTKILGFSQSAVSYEDGIQYPQYSILTLSRNRYQEYIFTPNEKGKYEYRIVPTIETHVDVEAQQHMTLEWGSGKLYINDGTQQVTLYDIDTQEFNIPKYLFEQEVIFPPRDVLILSPRHHALQQFLRRSLQILFLDEITNLPSIITQDVIVFGVRSYNLEDVILRLPPNSTPIIIGNIDG